MPEAATQARERVASIDLLLVEDNPGDVDLVREHLGRERRIGSLEVAGTLQQALQLLADRDFDAALLDLNLPDSRGIDTLASVLDASFELPVLVLTGLADTELGASAVRRGAQDFLSKDDITGPRLERALRHAIERQRHERELREAEARAQRYLDIADVLLVALDPEGRVTMVNRAGAELLGHDEPARLVGRSWLDAAVPSGERARIREIHAAILRDEEEHRKFESPVLTRSGKERTISWRSSVIRDEKDRVTGILSSGLDITERVEAERRLQRANRALRVMSGGNQALLRSGDEREIVEEVCRVAVEVGGYRFAWIGYVDEDDPSRVRVVTHRGNGGEYLDKIDLSAVADEGSENPIADALRSGEPAVVRGIRPPRESDSWEREALDLGYRSKLALPLGANGGRLGVLCIYSEEPWAFDEEELRLLGEVADDLAHGIATHRQKRRTEELEEQLQQAEKLRAVGQLAGGVAHDFNNYLTVIRSLTGMVLDDPAVDDEHREELEDVLEAAESSARLTRQLLTFSRRQVTALEDLDLNAVIADIGFMLQRIMKESIELDVDLAARPLPVHGDPGQVEQVVMNLAVNARDAMPDGGRLSIRTRAAEVADDGPDTVESLEPGPYAVLTVTDTGTGIDDADLSRIFEPFYSTKEEGTGMGLSTVYGVIKQAHGGVRVESEVGRGTTFEIYLPLLPEERLENGPVDESPSEQPEGGATVLVVEDEEAVRRAMRRILERSDHAVLECGSVAEALEIAEDADVDIDLLLTDLGLPDGSGREVAEAFVHSRPGTAVIYTSGYTPGELDYTLELGSRERFLEKPFDPEALTTAVHETLSGG